MKIAVVSDDERTISSHFGRSKGFIVLEVEGQEIKHREYRPNTFTHHREGEEHRGESQHSESDKYHRHEEIINDSFGL